MWNILTVPTVWYFNYSRQCDCRGQLNTTLSEQKEHSTLSGTVKIPQCKNSENITHCREKLKYHTVGSVRTFNICCYFPDSVVF
jgi:hypothetical protein